MNLTKYHLWQSRVQLVPHLTFALAQGGMNHWKSMSLPVPLLKSWGSVRLKGLWVLGRIAVVLPIRRPLECFGEINTAPHPRPINNASGKDPKRIYSNWFAPLARIRPAE